MAIKKRKRNRDADRNRIIMPIWDAEHQRLGDTIMPIFTRGGDTSRITTVQPADVGGGEVAYIDKVKALFGSSLIQYLPMNEASGTAAVDASGNGRNGAYTGVDLANAAAPAGIGGMAPYWDGVNDYNNVYSASLNTAFTPTIGSIGILFKMYNAAVWADNAYKFMVRIAADDNNRIQIWKGSNLESNVFGISHVAGGTTKQVTAAITPTTWQYAVVTWTKAGDEVKAYLAGSQLGATQTGLGVWVGALSNIRCVVGGFTTVPNFPNKGWLAHYYLLNRVQTPAEVAAVYGWTGL